jgi:hypothetical protein
VHGAGGGGGNQNVKWLLKGTLTRDFRALVFFIKQPRSPRPLMHRLKPFWIWLWIREDIRLWNCRVRFPYLKKSASDHSRRRPTKNVAQWCHWHCCNIHRRCHWYRCATKIGEYLRGFEAIFEKALTRVSEAQRKKFDEKKSEVENLVSGSL